MATFAYEDAVDPAALRIDVSPSNALPSLAGVTSAEIRVLSRPGGGTPTWSATLSNQTATTLQLTHVFASSNADVPTPGEYRLLPVLFVGANQYRCVPVTLLVKPLV